jgi:hypothetical protein
MICFVVKLMLAVFVLLAVFLVFRRSYEPR